MCSKMVKESSLSMKSSSVPAWPASVLHLAHCFHQTLHSEQSGSGLVGEPTARPHEAVSSLTGGGEEERREKKKKKKTTVCRFFPRGRKY